MSDDARAVVPSVEPSSSGVDDGINRLRNLLSERKKQTGSLTKNPSSEKEFRGAIAELMKSGPLADEIFALFSESPPDLVAEATEAVWGELDGQSKHRLTHGWQKQPPDKAVLRQVAIAGRLARFDGGATAEILRNVISRGTKDKLSEDKARQLRNHFFLNRTDWIDFDSSDKDAMKIVVPAFVQLAAEITGDPKLNKNALSYRFWRDFVAWAARLIASGEIDEPDRRSAIERLRSVARRLPDDYRDDVESLILKSVGPTEGSSPPFSSPEESRPSRLEGPTTAESSATKEDGFLATEGRCPDVGPSEDASASPIAETSRPVIQKQETRLGSSEQHRLETKSKEAAMVAAAVGTPRHVVDKAIEFDDPIAGAAYFIAQREAEIEGVKSLIDSFRRFQQSETALKREIELERQRAARLAIANASLSSRLFELENALNAAEERAANAMNEAQALTVELSSVKGKLDEANRRVDREVSARLENFKGRVRVKLHPIFENKRTTDGQEPNPKLAESLRRLFRQLEEELSDQGIKLS